MVQKIILLEFLIHSKNVMGMMPHPERAVDSLLGNEDGVPLFNSLLNKALT